MDDLNAALSRIDAAVSAVDMVTVDLQCGANIKAKAITWLWFGWLPAGKLTICAGAGGAGKTTLCLGIVAALTAGGTWPDGTRVAHRGNVLIWSGEDAADDTLIPRLQAMGADLSRVFFINSVADNGKTRAFDPAADINPLRKAINKIGGVSLMLIDPVVQAVSGDMHRANDVRRGLQGVVDLADEHGCAVIGITHFSKGSSDKNPAERVIGSQAFTALARMVWVAAKEEDGSKRVLAKAKTNIAEDHGGIEYAIEATATDDGIPTTRAVWCGKVDGTAREILGDVEHDDNKNSSDREDAEAFLVDLLSSGPIPTKQVKADADGAGHAWATVRRAQKALGIQAIRSGFGKDGAWTWQLSSKVLTNPHRCSEKNVSIYGESEHLCSAKSMEDDL